MAISPEILEYLQSHNDLVISEARDIIGTITNKEITIESQGIKDFLLEELTTAYPEPVVAVSIQVGGQPDALVSVFINKPTAARIGSLMMMLEDEQPQFTEEHLDSMREMLNQIVGAITTNLKEVENNPVSAVVVDAQEAPVSEDLFQHPDLISAQYTLIVGSDEPKTVFAVLTSKAVDLVMSGHAETAVGGETETETAVTEETETAGVETAELPAVETPEELSKELDFGSMLGEEPEEIEEAPVMEEAAPPAELERREPTEVERKMDFLMDLTFPISIELGRTKMLIKDILDLGHGSVIEFEKLASDPVDLLVDNRKIGEGEVVVVDEHFGVRITNLIHKAEMLREISSKKE